MMPPSVRKNQSLKIIKNNLRNNRKIENQTQAMEVVGGKLPLNKDFKIVPTLEQVRSVPLFNEIH